MLTVAELKRIAAAAWGSSNPIIELRLFEEAIRIEVANKGISIAEAEERVRQFIRYLPGILESPENANRARVNPTAPPSMSVDVLGASYMLDGTPRISDGGAVVIPRPGDGVTRELLGYIVSPAAAQTFETHGELKAAPAPVLDRFAVSGGAYETLVEGVDYSINYGSGVITTIVGSPRLQVADSIYLTAAWVGSWTVAVVYDKDGNVGAIRGRTSTPNLTVIDATQLEFERVQVAAVGPISDATTEITADLIDKSRAQYFGVQGLLKFFSSSPEVGHRHSGYPNDGPPAVLTLTIEAGETIPAFHAVARGDDGLAYLADNATPTRWGVLGITSRAYTAGQQMIVFREGKVTNPAWSWDGAGHRYIYVGTGGGLIQSSPVSGLIHQIGIVESATELNMMRNVRLVI